MKYFFTFITYIFNRYLLFGILLGFGGYYYAFLYTPGENNSTLTRTQSEIATLGNITESITVLGNTQLQEQQTLKFSKQAKVTQVYKQQGDSIFSGEKLASLDNSSVLINIEQLELNLENAKLKLEELYKPLDASKVLDHENKIESVEQSITTAKKELLQLDEDLANALENIEKNIEYKQKDIISLEKNLDDTLKSLEILKKDQEKTYQNTLRENTNTLENLILDYNSQLNNIGENIETMDLILGYSDKNRNKNDDFEIYLGAKDSSLKNLAENLFAQSYHLYHNAPTASKENLGDIFDYQENLYQTLYEASDALYKTLDASVESMSFTLQDISSKKSSISSIRSKILSQISSLPSQRQKQENVTDIEQLQKNQELTKEKTIDNIENIKTNIEKYNNDLKNLKKSIITTQDEYKTKKENKEISIKNLASSLEIAKQNYTESLAGPTELSIKNAQNDVKKAQLAINDAKKDLDNYHIFAPFDGIIQKIDILPGDIIENNSSKSIIVENPESIVIPVSLDQSDIVKVSMGQEAIITFDAYPGEKFLGKISAIDYTPESSQGVVTYQVQISLTQEIEKKILPGMTASIDIITQKHENVLLISSKALFIENGKNYVTLEKNGIQQKQEVKIGTTTSGKASILSGIQEGDTIILPEVKIETSSSSNNSQGLFPTGAGGMGGNMGGGMGGSMGGGNFNRGSR